METPSAELDSAIAWIRTVGEEVGSPGDREATLSRIREIVRAFRDALDGNQAWWDIQSSTGLSELRCKEIEGLFYSLPAERYNNV